MLEHNSHAETMEAGRKRPASPPSLSTSKIPKLRGISHIQLKPTEAKHVNQAVLKALRISSTEGCDTNSHLSSGKVSFPTSTSCSATSTSSSKNSTEVGITTSTSQITVVTHSSGLNPESVNNVSELEPVVLGSPGANMELDFTIGFTEDLNRHKQDQEEKENGGSAKVTGSTDSDKDGVDSDSVCESDTSKMVYRCSECDYASENKHYYKQHVDLVHNAARPYKCPFCDYAGKRSHALREHLIVHSTQRPYSCQHCNATFRKKGHLTNHTKLHGNTGPGIPTADSGLAGSVLMSESAVDRTAPSGSRPVSPNIDITNSALNVQNMAASRCRELWCALCKKAMASAAAFQEHLQSVHGTDHLYACGSCSFVTANKNAMMSHLSSHVHPQTPGSSSSGQLVTLPSNASISSSHQSAVSLQSSSITPVFACSQCGFNTPTMSVLVAHATKHLTQNSSNISSQAASLQTQPQVICSECGHVEDNTELMRAHMWTHIKAIPSDSEIEDKKQDQLKESVGSPDQMMVHDGSFVTSKPKSSFSENVSMKCAECNYISCQASQFVKHLLVHKTQQNQSPPLQSKTQQSLGPPPQMANAGPGTVLVSGSSQTTKGGTVYRVKPVSTENTCTNSESSPFVHDASTGRFRCTICGYSCEYQRTIKAHIWKHSGHRQIQYPIFQNGPLSMYEDGGAVSQPVVSTLLASGAVATSAPSHFDISVGSRQVPSVPHISRLELPVGATTTAKPVAVSGPSAGKPVSVRLITVSGSKVIQSSGLLPSTNIKLIPLSAAAAKAIADIKHLTSVVDLKNLTAVKSSTSKTVSSHDLILGRTPASPLHTCNVSDVTGSEKERSVCITIENSQTDTVVMTSKAIHSNEAQKIKNLQVSLDTQSEKAETKAIFAVPNANKSENQIKFRKKEICSDTSPKEQTVEVVPVNSSPLVSQQTVLAPIPFQCNIIKTGAVERTDLNQGNLCSASLNAHAAGSPTADSRRGGINTNAASPKETDCKLTEGVTVKTDCKLTEGVIAAGSILVATQPQPLIPPDTDLETDFSIASRVQARHKKYLSPSEELSVVVETMETLPAHAVLTGLHSQASSPRVQCHINTSPVNTDVDEDIEEEDESCSGERTDASQNVSVRTLQLGRTWAERQQRAVSCEQGSHSNMRSDTSGGVTTRRQSQQDSESAVTLLSLLSRGSDASHVPPAISTETSPVDADDTNGDSSCGTLSLSSDGDSSMKATSVDLSTDDTGIDKELAAKSRAGGGGICSTLLAVIEQLRERSGSRSESESEDKCPVSNKKRSGRGRGREQSEHESLEVADSENVETLNIDRSISYRCRLCHYTSNRVPLIRLHMRTHRQKDPFECSLCPMVAESSEMLQEHMIKHCKVRTYACKFCPQSFNHKSTLRAHMRAHNDSEPFLCDLCDFETTRQLDYRSHLQKHVGQTLIRCPYCPALVNSRQDLRNHLMDSCHGRESDLLEERIELASEAGDKFSCSQCDFTALSLGRMEEHVASHCTATVVMGLGSDREGSLHCGLCDFTAVSSRSLKSHMKRHANDQRYVQQPLEQYKCSLCGYVCHHLPSLKSHMWRHASDQNYSYQFTNDIINAAIDYDTRPAEAANQKKVEAPNMPAPREVDDSNLLDRTERRIVEGQLKRAGGCGGKPICWVTFRCCQCGFETINKAKLNLHMRTHTDIIQRTVKVKPGSGGLSGTRSSVIAKGISQLADGLLTDVDAVKVRIVYGPV